MKITITMPDNLYKKLESDRGAVPRSTYIQGLIGGQEDGVVVDKLMEKVFPIHTRVKERSKEEFAREATDDEMEEFNKEYEKAEEKMEFKSYFKDKKK